MLWPGALVKLSTATTKRLKLMAIVDMKDIMAFVDVPATSLSRLTYTERKDSEIWHCAVLSRTLCAVYEVAPEQEYGGGKDGFMTFETVNETGVLEVMVPLVNVTVKTPLARLAVAAGLPPKPENEETTMSRPGTLVKLFRVTTKRLKPLIFVGVKDIMALVVELMYAFSK